MTPLSARAARWLSGVRSAPLRHGAAKAVLAASLGGHARRTLRAAGAVGPDAEMRAEVYRGYWEDAARAAGADVGPAAGGRLRLRRGDRSVVVWGNLVPIDHPVSLRIAGSRPDTHAALEAAGLRVPRHEVVTGQDLRAAERLLAEVGRCVVKPGAFTGAGTAVTCGVRTTGDLLRAVVVARRWGDQVVVEEQVAGAEHRLLVLDGQVLGAVLRQPPHLVGDGRSTIAQLVASANAQRSAARGSAGLFPLTLDLDVVQTQHAAARSLRSIPADGERFQVKTAVNENAPADNVGLAEVPPELRELAVAAAAAVGLRLAAVEVIVPTDGSTPAVLEVNSTPGLHYHYQVAEDSHIARVARPLLEVLLAPVPPRLPELP